MRDIKFDDEVLGFLRDLLFSPTLNIPINMSDIASRARAQVSDATSQSIPLKPSQKA